MDWRLLAVGGAVEPSDHLPGPGVVQANLRRSNLSPRIPNLILGLIPNRESPVSLEELQLDGFPHRPFLPEEGEEALPVDLPTRLHKGVELPRAFGEPGQQVRLKLRSQARRVI